MEDVGVDRFWHQRIVLVTGATGLLGSWLVERLVEYGASVVCLVRDWVPSSRLVTGGTYDHVTVVRGDLESLEVAIRTLNEYEIDTVFHLGAQTIVGAASRSPLSTFESNIRGTWTLLEACRLAPSFVQRIVVASSDKAYGAHDQLPYTEDAPLIGRFPYDVSKSCADLIGQSYAHTYGLPIVVTRCGNLYGGGDLNFNRLVPGTIRSLLAGEPPVIRSDGTFVRDYFYVRDAVDAYLDLAARLPHDEWHGEAFNFGTETPASVVEVVDLLRDLMDAQHLMPIIQNQTTHEIPQQYLACAKAREHLGWSSHYDLRHGLTETIEWYTEWLGHPDPGQSRL